METWQEGFDNRFTEAFGLPIERVATKIKEMLSEPVAQFIAESPFLVMSTSSKDGKCDASPKGGNPGFVRILDDCHLLVPDVAGNKLFQSYLNMDENPHVGLLFFIPGQSDVVRVNGRVTMVDRQRLDQHEVENDMYNDDGNRGVLQGIVVEVEEAYTHCPRAITYSMLWDAEKLTPSGARPDQGKTRPRQDPTKARPDQG